MPRKGKIVIEQGILNNGSGTLENIVFQKNGVIRIKPIPYKKGHYNRKQY